MLRELKQRIKDEIIMRKEDILWLLGKEEKIDPSTLTVAEQWVQREITYYRKIRFGMGRKYIGFHYSEHYVRTHPAEEVYARYLRDVANEYQFLEDCYKRKKAMSNEK